MVFLAGLVFMLSVVVLVLALRAKPEPVFVEDEYDPYARPFGDL